MDQCEMHGITLTGDLSLIGVKEQAILMARHMAGPEEMLPDKTGKHRSHGIDLSGVQALDACGCQLLVLFMRNLRERGVREFSLTLSDDSRSKIRSLGFEETIFSGECR